MELYCARFSTKGETILKAVALSMEGAKSAIEYKAENYLGDTFPDGALEYSMEKITPTKTMIFTLLNEKNEVMGSSFDCEIAEVIAGINGYKVEKSWII